MLVSAAGMPGGKALVREGSGGSSVYQERDSGRRGMSVPPRVVILQFYCAHNPPGVSAVCGS